MSSDAAHRYRARFRQVLDFVDTHLDENLALERLAAVAAFSKHHFHRQFTQLFGMGVYRYVQLRRLRRASWQLAFRESMPVTDIALGSGYEGPEAFARAFRKHTGQSPSEFRREPQWDLWNAICQPLSELRIQHMTLTYSRDQVRIVDFPATRVAALEHRGDPRRLGVSVRRFIEWRKANRLPPKISATFNIAHDDPDLTPAADFRFDLCAATDRDIEPNDAGIVVKTIPAGRCAVIRHIGPDDLLATTIAYLYSEWLPGSGAEPRDYPLYFQRVSFFPDVPEHEAVTDVFLPIDFPAARAAPAANNLADSRANQW